MSYIYTYNIPGLVYLEDVIDKLVHVNLNPYNILYHNDTFNLDITYEIELTDIQLFDLNLFFNNYTPLTQKAQTYFVTYNIQVSQNKPSSIDYTLCGTYHYIPNSNLDSDATMKLSYISSSKSTYQIRLYNATTNTVMGESGLLSNSTSQINILDLNGVPSDISILEVHVKISDPTVVVSFESAQLNVYC